MAINVGRYNDHGFMFCPICGKPDWCNTGSDSDGNIYFTCKRIKGSDNVIGTDGRYYVFTGTSKMEGHNKYEEANQLAARKGLSYDKKVFVKQTARKVEPKEMVKALPDEKLDRIYSTLLNSLVLESEHKEYLLREGWSEEMIKRSGVKSFPVSDYERKSKGIKSSNPLRFKLAGKLFDMYGDLTGVPGLYLAKSKRTGTEYWTFAPKGGILFPIKNVLGQVYRLRVRLDKVASGGKYRNFSSYVIDKDTGENYYKNGCQANNAVGCYLKPYYQEADWYMVDVTEGEKKAFIVNELLNTPTFSIPGTGSYAMFLEYIGYLKAMGTKVVLLGFDADKRTNKYVAAHESSLAKALVDAGFSVGTREWDIRQGKGIDDCLLAGYKTSLKTF